ncbi:MAG: hypothetical protein HJJLKODD_00473 [Phycisphaerae bacterium]|nr:hypothetical protein [Phycisphaerae bacterium]
MFELLTQVNPSLNSKFDMARLIEAKDPYTAGHTWRVANYGQVLGAALGFQPEQIEMLLWAGTLHDIGKINVPDEILCKPGRLTDEEFAVLKRHPQDGFDLLSGTPEFNGVLNVVLLHHEAYDGRGYPLGLVSEEIPREARLFAVVDAFDAMTSNRCYRPAMHADNAIYEIWRNRGRQFDPEIADTFIQLYRDGLLEHVIGHSDFGVKVGACPQCGPVIELSNNHHLDQQIVCPICNTSYQLQPTTNGEWQLSSLAG